MPGNEATREIATTEDRTDILLDFIFVEPLPSAYQCILATKVQSIELIELFPGFVGRGKPCLVDFGHRFASYLHNIHPWSGLPGQPAWQQRGYAGIPRPRPICPVCTPGCTDCAAPPGSDRTPYQWAAFWKPRRTRRQSGAKFVQAPSCHRAGRPVSDSRRHDGPCRLHQIPCCRSRWDPQTRLNRPECLRVARIRPRSTETTCCQYPHRPSAG